MDEQKRYWKDILSKSPTQENIALIVKALETDQILCKILPRRGVWFNKVRLTMNLAPKQLRHILVKNQTPAPKI